MPGEPELLGLTKSSTALPFAGRRKFIELDLNLLSHAHTLHSVTLQGNMHKPFTVNSISNDPNLCHETALWTGRSE